MPINTAWFQNRIADRRMSQRALARALGMDPGALSLTLRGKRTMKMTEAADIARLLGVPAEEVIENAGVSVSTKGQQLQITGYVDGSGEVHRQMSEKLGLASHPGGELPLDVDVIACRTGNSDLDHMDGWLLFVEKTHSGIPAEAVGRLSLCKLSNGITALAKPTRSHQRGKWDLSGPSMTAQAVALEYAAPVLLIVT